MTDWVNPSRSTCLLFELSIWACLFNGNSRAWHNDRRQMCVDAHTRTHVWAHASSDSKSRKSKPILYVCVQASDHNNNNKVALIITCVRTCFCYTRVLFCLIILSTRRITKGEIWFRGICFCEPNLMETLAHQTKCLILNKRRRRRVTSCKDVAREPVIW